MHVGIKAANKKITNFLISYSHEKILCNRLAAALEKEIPVYFLKSFNVGKKANAMSIPNWRGGD